MQTTGLLPDASWIAAFRRDRKICTASAVVSVVAYAAANTGTHPERHSRCTPSCIDTCTR